MRKINYFSAFIIIGILGTLWHFFYDITDNAFVGFLAPVSESTWEHLKILFYPTVIYSIFEYLFVKNKPENYVAASSVALFSGLLSIVVLFYTYTGILGFDVSSINILIFFISLLVMLLIKSYAIKNELFPSYAAQLISIFFILLFIILFAVFSKNPPSLGLFTPPVFL